MSTRITMAAVFVVGLALLVPSKARAQEHSVNLSLGYFAVRGEDARLEDDVLVENLRIFSFELGDFNNATAGADWLIRFGDYLETGVGVGFYRRTVASTYDDFVDVDGTEIEQALKLRVAPVTATIRFLPFGRHAVEPYIGVGAGIFSWRYSEVGEFLDFSASASRPDIFRDRFVADGNDVGAVVLGGVRAPVGSRYAVGAELRYQEAHGTVGIEQGFLDERIDLGGLTTQFTFQVRF